LVQQRGIAGKASEDFNKRAGTESPLCAFIFATSRRFSDQEIWTAERPAEQKFRVVRVIDADDLETWLEFAPAVHLWGS
jgi:hypothetical protein